MNLEQYQRYVACFNARDYEGLHAFFADDVALHVNGYELKGKAGISSFYDFFHAHVRETVRLRHFIEGGCEGEGVDFADVLIRFEGVRELTAEHLAERGFSKMTPVPAGASVEINFFITYESRAGKIALIRCGIFEAPQSH